MKIKRERLWLVVFSILILAAIPVSAYTSEAPASTPITLTILTTTVVPVPLGMVGNFEVLAKSGISNTETTKIVGDIGISPSAATFITRFGLIMDASNQFSTSSLVSADEVKSFKDSPHGK